MKLFVPSAFEFKHTAEGNGLPIRFHPFAAFIMEVPFSDVGTVPVMLTLPSEVLNTSKPVQATILPALGAVVVVKLVHVSVSSL